MTFPVVTSFEREAGSVLGSLVEVSREAPEISRDKVAVFKLLFRITALVVVQ